MIAGHIKWTSYRTGQKPTIRIEHHKTGARHRPSPFLEERLPTGEIVRFYEEAEAVQAKLVRRGVPMILLEVEEGVSSPLLLWHAKDCPAHEKSNWPARRSSPWTPVGTGYDRTRWGGTDRGPRTRPICAPRPGKQFGMRQAHRCPDAFGDLEAPRPHAGEPSGNRRSECGI